MAAMQTMYTPKEANEIRKKIHTKIREFYSTANLPTTNWSLCTITKITKKLLHVDELYTVVIYISQDGEKFMYTK